MIVIFVLDTDFALVWHNCILTHRLLSYNLLEFMYLVFTCIPGESNQRQLGSLSLCLCVISWALINSLVCWSCSGSWNAIDINIYIYTHNHISAMISKMFIVLHILVQIYFRLVLYLYLARGIYTCCILSFVFLFHFIFVMQ